MSLRLRAIHTERVHAHLCRAYPEEGCGVLVGRDEGAMRIVERVVETLGESEQPLYQRTRRLPLRAHRMPRTPSIQHPAELWRLTPLLPQRVRTRVSSGHFRSRPAFGGKERCPQVGLHHEFLLETLRGVWQRLE